MRLMWHWLAKANTLAYSIVCSHGRKMFYLNQPQLGIRPMWKWSAKANTLAYCQSCINYISKKICSIGLWRALHFNLKWTLWWCWKRFNQIFIFFRFWPKLAPPRHLIKVTNRRAAGIPWERGYLIMRVLIGFWSAVHCQLNRSLNTVPYSNNLLEHEQSNT